MHQCLFQWDGDRVEVVHVDDSIEISPTAISVWDAEDQELISVHFGHHQTMAIQRLEHGHDWQNQPSIQQGSPVHFCHHGLFHQMGGGHPYEVGDIKECYQFYQRACYS
jgi:hypothetical protein